MASGSGAFLASGSGAVAASGRGAEVASGRITKRANLAVLFISSYASRADYRNSGCAQFIRKQKICCAFAVANVANSAAWKLDLAAECDHVRKYGFNYKPLGIFVAYAIAAIMIALPEKPAVQTVSAFIVCNPIWRFDYCANF